MAEIKKIFCGDFVNQVRQFEEATDGRGNKLFNRLEIAEFMGFDNVNQFEQKLVTARTMYRKNLQKKVRSMNEEEGLTLDQISERTRMSTDTIDILLNEEFDENANLIDKLREQRKKADEELRDSINSAFGKNSIFGNPFGL